MRFALIAAAIGGLGCGLGAADLVARGAGLNVVIIVGAALVGGVGTLLGVQVCRDHGSGRAGPPAPGRGTVAGNTDRGSVEAADLLPALVPPRQRLAQATEEHRHEIGNALTALSGAATVLATAGPGLPAERVVALGGAMASEVDRLRELMINRAGRPQTYDVCASIRPLVTLARMQGQRIAASMPAKAVAFGRPQAVSQVVSNLLQNTARHAPGAPVDVVVTVTPTAVSITVGNTLSATSTGASSGSGLGLELCRRIARTERGGLTSRSTARRYETTLVVPAAGVLTVRRPPVRRRPGLSEV